MVLTENSCSPKKRVCRDSTPWFFSEEYQPVAAFQNRSGGRSKIPSSYRASAAP